MQRFGYENGQLVCDGVAVADVVAEFGTPLYVYSEAVLRDNFRAIRDAFAEADPIICYAIKANYNLALCKVLADEGAGFDIVSGGELFRATTVGADPRKVVFAGVGKTRQEIEAALKADILFFNVESRPELARINEIAGELGVEARVVFRVNPDVDANTHKHTTTGVKGVKFGIDLAAALELVDRMCEFPNVRLVGVHVHLGSPINTVDPYVRGLERVVDFIDECRSRGVDMEYLDIGGGFGIEYKGGETARPADYAQAILPYVKKSGCKVVIEPGRYLVGETGVLVTQVQYVKNTDVKRFVICDAGMNDLIRPAMYDSYHRIWPVRSKDPVPHGAEALEAPTDGRVLVDVVGPVCESGDFFAKDRFLPPVKQGDLIAIFAAGAYAFSMSSNYNSRPKACEVMISDGSYRVIRDRETYEQMIASEKL
jgi:diaminopimelate decarboxylase